MATVVVTLKIMPDSPDSDLDAISASATGMISGFGGNVGKKMIEPIAFGLKAVILMFTMPEEKGSTEELEKQVSGISGVSSVQITDVRRAVG